MSRYYYIEVKDLGNNTYQSVVLEDADEYVYPVIIQKFTANDFYEAMMLAYKHRAWLMGSEV